MTWHFGGCTASDTSPDTEVVADDVAELTVDAQLVDDVSRSGCVPGVGVAVGSHLPEGWSSPVWAGAVGPAG